MAKLSESDVQFIQDLPVSHLATVTEACAPMVRPVWHVFDGKTIYFASDQTPKLKHITAHPNVSIVFDAYDPNNWENLRGIRFEGNAEILWTGQEYRHAHELLKSKYLEYRTVDGGWREGEIPIIKIVPAHVWKWAHGAWQKPYHATTLALQNLKRLPQHISTPTPNTTGKMLYVENHRNKSAPRLCKSGSRYTR